MANKTSGFLAEFKTFIARGNVMDMAVGVIIGGAFSNITTSLINDIVMPFLGIFTSSVSFAELAVNVGPAVITYGNFIQGYFIEKFSPYKFYGVIFYAGNGI